MKLRAISVLNPTTEFSPTILFRTKALFPTIVFFPRYTGPEIWKQTDGKVTHVVVASGTGGTISGTGKYLKEQNPDIQILGVDAVGSVLKKYHETGELDPSEIKPYKIEGLGKNLIPTATDFSVIDTYEKVTDKEAALCAREILETEGIFGGYTTGAVWCATKQYAKKEVIFFRLEFISSSYSCFEIRAFI